MGIEDKQDNITPVHATDLDLSLDKYKNNFIVFYICKQSHLRDLLLELQLIGTCLHFT